MKLEVGMYVRLNCNYELGIGKTIEEIDEDNFIKTKFKDNFECSLPTYMITKASHNIIDLIEVGDYVNGYEVKDIDYAFDDIALNVKKPRIVPYIDNIKNAYIDNIKSVITHEQMEQMAYKVGE